jgi:hypothetical protein
MLYNTFVSNAKVFTDGPLPELQELEFKLITNDNKLFEFHGNEHSFSLEILELVDLLFRIKLQFDLNLVKNILSNYVYKILKDDFVEYFPISKRKILETLTETQVNTLKAVMLVAENLLEKEKEQIRNAFKKGRYAIEVRDEETRVLLEKHTDEYYNETYNQNEG